MRCSKRPAGRAPPARPHPAPVQDLRAAGAARVPHLVLPRSSFRRPVALFRGCAMLKRGRSISGIELLPAELDFAASAEIGPPVDLTCATLAPLQLWRTRALACASARASTLRVTRIPLRRSDTVAPEPADASFGAWLAEATARARLAVAQARARQQHATRTAAAQALRGRTLRAPARLQRLTRPRASRSRVAPATMQRQDARFAAAAAALLLLLLLLSAAEVR